MTKLLLQTIFGEIGIELSEPDADGNRSAELVSSFMHGEDDHHVIESIVLAHAAAGVDVESCAYITGLETAIEAIANNS